MNINRYIGETIGYIGGLDRRVRGIISGLVLILECVGIILLSHKLPFSDTLKAGIVCPLLLSVLMGSAWFLWLNLGCLRVDATPRKCLRLPSSEHAPEIHCWEFSFNLRNPTPWDVTMLECALAKKVTVSGNELIFEKCEVVSGPTIARQGTTEIRSQFQCRPHENCCGSVTDIFFCIEYIIGGGMRREDRYKCSIQISE